MQNFISTCLQKILSNSANPISKAVFVVPSKRAGVFLKKELSNQCNATMFLPKIISIETFIEEVSGIKASTGLETMFAFYKVYSELIPAAQKEPFETFSKWAQLLLHDFNEIDRYRIDAKPFFKNLSDIKQIENWSPNETPTPLIQEYLGFWENAYHYYDKLQQELLQQGIGYQGLVYREASSQIEHYIQSNTADHYFLGFNALNASEELIFQELIQQQRATVFWDIDQVFMASNTNNASHFLRQYKKEWKTDVQSEFSIVSSNFSDPKNIDLIGIPKNIGQVKKVGEILSHLSALELKETAVVLGDESLLIPLLNSLPKNITDINITMGMALKDIPLTAFFESIFQLYVKKTGSTFYYKKILNLLHNNYTKILFGTTVVDRIIADIQKNNSIHISLALLEKITPLPPLLKDLLLLSSLDVLQNVSVFKQVILTLKNHFSKHENDLLEQEYLFRFNEVFNNLSQLQQKHKSIESITAFYQIYKELLSTQTLDFRGEPVQGLQIMGMLESRVLDFKRVIITSVNEGILPAGKSQNSFIPFDLKKDFKLPTFFDKDAVYAYHFFRLLQRATDVHLIYNTEAGSLNSGEKSRFLLQLEAFKIKNHNISHQRSAPTILPTSTVLQAVEKDEQVMLRLSEIAKAGFSPSALTNYIRNPLEFYHQRILKLYDDDEVEETVAANTIGTIVHETLKAFYKPLENQILTVEMIKKMQQDTEKEVFVQFEKEFKKGDISKGKNHISVHIVKRYISNFLKTEIRLIENSNEVIIRKIESKLTKKLDIPALDFPVYIKGEVDRVDEVDGVLRIIDYKTGKVERSKVEIVDWNAITTDYDSYKNPFQILCYAYMLTDLFTTVSSVETGIISFKNLKSGFLKFAKKDKTGNGAIKDTQVTQETLEYFTAELCALIVEICNINIPFTEKEV